LNAIEPLLGFAVVICFLILVIFFSTKRIRVKFPPVFRKIQGANNLRRAIGETVEAGTRMHISIGSGSLIDPSSPSALVGLSTLDRIEQLTSTSDLPPMCTSGSGSFQLLSQDVSRQSLVESNANELLHPGLIHMAGATSFAYVVGTMEAMHDAGTQANVFAGSFGVESGLLCDEADNEKTYVIAGSDSIIAQSVFFALAKDTLIGEELYALPAYLGYHPTHQASLRVQDIFRLGIILILIVGVLIKVLAWI
jgi:hypothetical protein